jgi:hypothetical protein
VWFQGGRYGGWAVDLPADAGAPGCLTVMRPLAGSAPHVHEIARLSEDRRRRWRSSQLLRDGLLVGRTLIDEEKLSDDWRRWDAER